ncbi:MAG: C40 family peptidase [Chitinispirillia bacterium]|nr:C40 family peptidase [Chitinispirillia bacterium]
MSFDGIRKNIITAAAFVIIALTLGGCSPSVRYTREQQPQSSAAGSSQSTQSTRTGPQQPSAQLPRPGSRASQNKLVQAAESYLGTPYKYGGMSRAGVDCSGYTVLVYREVYGVNLPRTSAKMWKKGRPLSVSAARPGDLCFFRMRGKKGKIDHVGIYMGNNRFIHASTSSGVMYNNLKDDYYSKRFAGIRRML